MTCTSSAFAGITVFESQIATDAKSKQTSNYRYIEALRVPLLKLYGILDILSCGSTNYIASLFHPCHRSHRSNTQSLDNFIKEKRVAIELFSCEIGTKARGVEFGAATVLGAETWTVVVHHGRWRS
jgi:hypothetical protein